VDNIRATSWPLLAVLGAQHPAWLRRVTHGAVLASLAPNLLPAAAAIGVYRSALVPYLPPLARTLRNRDRTDGLAIEHPTADHPP
jgi:hypothetical protein